MKAKAFEELLGSIREGGAILRGEKKPSRRFEISAGECDLCANERACRNRNLRL